ncbi:STAS/SEC14 domain-containing protein [Lutibacter sp.]|uniref:STAS/SEC14 domain-containing protein n=1 Tax=Lutibacter sp. TaxID=1925666 RepID=UPI0025C28D70|nr:STAS/SEC14 domain-containing protein [Lutibacter sp.]
MRYTHSGLINAQDIESAWSVFLSLNEFTQLKYNLLSDYRNGKFNIPIEEIPKIVEFMKAIQHIVEGKKQALIVDDSYSAAASMLFEESVYLEVGFKVKLFSTETAALKWLAD